MTLAARHVVSAALLFATFQTFFRTGAARQADDIFGGSPMIIRLDSDEGFPGLMVPMVAGEDPPSGMGFIRDLIDSDGLLPVAAAVSSGDVAAPSTAASSPSPTSKGRSSSTPARAAAADETGGAGARSPHSKGQYLQSDRVPKPSSKGSSSPQVVTASSVRGFGRPNPIHAIMPPMLRGLFGGGLLGGFGAPNEPGGPFGSGGSGVEMVVGSTSGGGMPLSRGGVANVVSEEEEVIMTPRGGKRRSIRTESDGTRTVTEVEPDGTKTVTRTSGATTSTARGRGPKGLDVSDFMNHFPLHGSFFGPPQIEATVIGDDLGFLGQRAAGGGADGGGFAEDIGDAMLRSMLESLGAPQDVLVKMRKEKDDPCAADVAKLHCNGPHRLHCLGKNQDVLAKPCRESIAKSVPFVCHRQIDQYKCTVSSQGTVVDCLEPHKNELAEDCRDSVEVTAHLTQAFKSADKVSLVDKSTGGGAQQPQDEKSSQVVKDLVSDDDKDKNGAASALHGFVLMITGLSAAVALLLCGVSQAAGVSRLRGRRKAVKNETELAQPTETQYSACGTSMGQDDENTAALGENPDPPASAGYAV